MSQVVYSEAQPLSPVHELNKISAGHDQYNALKTFLQRRAIQFSDGNIAKTYVITIEGSKKVVAYITLSSSQVELSDIPDNYRDKSITQYKHLPALKIGRLLVCSKHRGNGLGEKLLKFTCVLASHAIMPAIGCRYILVDSQENAEGFYSKFGFVATHSNESGERDTKLMAIDLAKAMDYAPPTESTGRNLRSSEDFVTADDLDHQNFTS